MDSIITLNTEQKDLSIRVHSNGFSFYLSDQHGEIDAQFIAFNALSAPLAQLKDSIYSYQILFSAFRSYNLIVEANQYILTPSLLFDPVSAREQTKLLFAADYTKEYFFEEILPLSVVNCYSFDSEMYGFLNRTFQFNHVISLSSLLILDAHAQRSEQGKTMFVYVNDTSVHIIVYTSSNLEFQICHPKFSPMNCTYYALKTWELHHLNQKEDRMLLIGDSEYCNEVLRNAEKYVEHIEVKEPVPLTEMIGRSSQKVVSNII